MGRKWQRIFWVELCFPNFAGLHDMFNDFPSSPLYSCILCRSWLWFPSRSAMFVWKWLWFPAGDSFYHLYIYIWIHITWFEVLDSWFEACCLRSRFSCSKIAFGMAPQQCGPHVGEHRQSFSDLEAIQSGGTVDALKIVLSSNLEILYERWRVHSYIIIYNMSGTTIWCLKMWQSSADGSAPSGHGHASTPSINSHPNSEFEDLWVPNQG